MPKRVIYQASIEYLQILDEEGNLDVPLAEGTLSDDQVRHLYQQMVIYRHFDDTAFKLQRSGRMGTFPQNKGQEAVAVASAAALTRGVDYVVPFYRDNAMLFEMGLPMHQVLLHWMGDERGNEVPKNLSLSMSNLMIGAQVLHGPGIAWAFKLRKEPRVVLTTFGDGATSEGDFHAGMNFAAVFKVPCVFTCYNNQYAISVPRSRQTASETFAQKALAYGIPTIQVDGNDIFAVYKSHKDAVERARGGGGPSFIEAVTYRLTDHTTADDARRYRPEGELEEALKREPLVRTRKYLEKKKLWDAPQQAALEERAKKLIREVVDTAINIETPQTSDLFDYVYQSLPPHLRVQRETLRTDSIGQNPSQIGLQVPKEPDGAELGRERLAHS